MTDPPEKEKFSTEYKYEQLFKRQILIAKIFKSFCAVVYLKLCEFIS